MSEVSVSSKSVAVVGCGHWGKNLIRNFDGLGALRMICDQDAGILEERKKAYPHLAPTQSYDEVLREPTISGVVLATPAICHYDQAREALLAGKDVFVEKPLALTHPDGRELVRLARERKRILMVGHVLEYHPGIRRLNELLQSGELGSLRYIYSHRLSLGKIRREENILWSFAPHDIAIILRMTGSLPFEVVACGGSYIQANIADVTVTHLLFDNGVRAHIHVSWLHPFKEQRLVVIGSRKMASFDDVNKRLVLYDQRVEFNEHGPLPIRGDGQEVSYPGSEPLRLECESFLEAMTTRQPPLTDGESGLEVLKVLQAAQRSLVMNGHSVVLPLEGQAVL